MLVLRARTVAIALSLCLSEGTAHAQRPAAGQNTQGSIVRVMRAGQAISRLATSIPIRLPRDVIRMQGGVATLALRPSQSLTIDPDRGAWYTYVDNRPGYDVTVEGDRDLLVAANGCSGGDRRPSSIEKTLAGRARISERTLGLKKEILVVSTCVPYRIVVECDVAGAACETEKAKFRATTLAALVTAQRLDIPEALAQRSLLAATAGPILPAAPRPAGSAGEFRYYSPGLLLVRQYMAPGDCHDIAAGREILIDQTTPFARDVFAGPQILKRFPIVLGSDQNAFANSQLFGPGGTFYATPDGEGRSHEDIAGRDCGAIADDGTMGTFGAQDAFDARNFAMPWADTFCEWRANGYTQPFCAAHGGPAMLGPHYGVDVRAATPSLEDDVAIVSASDGVVVEVDRKPRDAGGGLWEGFGVKIRSRDLILVYRHLNPATSPFRHDAPDRLKLGDRVAAGQRIGTMGNFDSYPGGTTKHLHFEIEAPVPREVAESPSCSYAGDASSRAVRVCSAREKAPAYASLIVAYFAERYGMRVPLETVDGQTGVPVLPELPGHEIGRLSNAPPSGK